MRYYKWGYSWNEIKGLYIAKEKDRAKRRQVDYEFLIELASAALGSGKKSDGSYDLDSGEGLENMTEEQEAELRLALGDDFDKIYGS